MKPTDCPREPLVRNAVTTGMWSDGLRDHVAFCSACAETALVAQCLRDLADEFTIPPLPSASAVWRRAELQSRLEATKRATLPITAMNWIAGILGVGAVAGVGIWQLPSLMEGFRIALHPLVTPAAGLLGAAPVVVIAASLAAIGGFWALDRFADA